MLDRNSRYAATAQALYRARDGREIPYRQRRLLPQAGPPRLGLQVTVEPADRLDLIAARQLGDPLAFWRIADANGAMNPFDLALPGRRLVIPLAHPKREGPT